MKEVNQRSMCMFSFLIILFIIGLITAPLATIAIVWLVAVLCHSMKF